MRTIATLGGLAVVLLAAAPGAQAQTIDVGNVCQPKTSADSGRLRYNGARVMNTSTTNSAAITCPIGYQTGFPQVVVDDNNGNAGQNISCTAFYYVTGILSNIGARTTSGTGSNVFLSWSQPPFTIGESWFIECTLPPAVGAAESQMSSVNRVFGG